MRFIVLLFTLLVFLTTIPLQASAESWVLWTKEQQVESNLSSKVIWQILNAYEKYKDCIQEKTRTWQTTKNMFEADKQFGKLVVSNATPDGMITAHYKTGGSIAVNLYCLPGTLDPRK